MGVILDSSVIIAAERRGRTVRQILEQVRASQGNIEIGLSVVTVAELVHGAYRAGTPTQQEQRLAFIERLCRDISVYPVTLNIARLVGRIEGQQEASGTTIISSSLISALPEPLHCVPRGNSARLGAERIATPFS